MSCVSITQFNVYKLPKVALKSNLKFDLIVSISKYKGVFEERFIPNFSTKLLKLPK